MRIAVWHNLPSGGAKRALYEMVRGLVARGHHVEAWCPASADPAYLPLREWIPEHVLPFEWTPRPWGSGLRGAAGAYQDTARQIRLLDRHSRECAEQINRGGFDLLFVHPCMYQAVGPIGRYVRLPRVLYLQEPLRPLYEALPSLPWAALPSPRRFAWSPRYLRWFLPDLLRVQTPRLRLREEQFNARRFQRILVNSLYSRESILRAYGLESDVCYLGINADRFHPTHVPRENFTIGLGAIRFHKGLDRAIRALAALPPADRPPLVWIGNDADPDYERQTRQLAADLGVELCLKTAVSDPEVIDLFNRARLMLYTSRLEPFGFAPLEANACETPVVAIAEGGVRETVAHEHNGLLVPGSDPVALSRAILHLLRNPELAHRMGQLGRQRVLGHWTWDATLDRLETYLHATLPDTLNTDMRSRT